MTGYGDKIVVPKLSKDGGAANNEHVYKMEAGFFQFLLWVTNRCPHPVLELKGILEFSVLHGPRLWYIRDMVTNCQRQIGVFQKKPSELDRADAKKWETKMFSYPKDREMRGYQKATLERMMTKGAGNGHLVNLKVGRGKTDPVLQYFIWLTKTQALPTMRYFIYATPSSAISSLIAEAQVSLKIALTRNF